MAHISLGTVRLAYDHDWARTEESLRRAIELDRNEPWAHYNMAWYYLAAGRVEEAIDAALTSVELDPVNHSFTSALASIDTPPTFTSFWGLLSAVTKLPPLTAGTRARPPSGVLISR